MNETPCAAPVPSPGRVKQHCGMNGTQHSYRSSISITCHLGLSLPPVSQWPQGPVLISKVVAGCSLTALIRVHSDFIWLLMMGTEGNRELLHFSQQPSCKLFLWENLDPWQTSVAFPARALGKRWEERMTVPRRQLKDCHPGSHSSLAFSNGP